MLTVSPASFLSGATVGTEGALTVRVLPGQPWAELRSISWTHPEAPFMVSAKFILSVGNLAGSRAYFKPKVQSVVFVEGRKCGWIITLWFSCVFLFHGLQEIFFFPFLAVCPEWQKYIVRWLNQKKSSWFKILSFWNHFSTRVLVFPAHTQSWGWL